jgi:4-amino-4-deoxy-L-arabinose transferase-like glycosyltransferase
MKPRYSLLLILLLALALRLINLGERNLWYDEAFAILFADQGLEQMLYGTLTPVAGGAADIHPLLYYVTLDGWMSLFGAAPFAVRLWSVVLGVVTVGVMFLLGRDLFDVNTGLAAALVTTLAPFHVQYAQEARMYSLLALLLLLATWCFVWGWRSLENGGVVGARHASPLHADASSTGDTGGVRRLASGWLWWIGFGVLAGLAMYTQQLAAFYLVALGLVPVLLRRRDLLLRVSVGAGIAVVVYLPWLLQLPGQLEKVGSYYWIPAPDVLRPLATLRAFFISGIDIPALPALLALAGSVIVTLFLGLQMAMGRRSRARRGDSTERTRQASSLRVVLWLFVAPIALMWLASQIRPVYLERGLIGSALMLYLLLGWLFTRGGLPRPIAAVIGGIALALAGMGLFYHYTWNSFPNSPFDEAAEHIRAQFQPGDAVVHQNKLSALPMLVYARDLPQHYVMDAPGSPEDTLALPTQEVIGYLADECIQAAANGANRVWFIVFADALRQYEQAGRDDLRAAYDWLETHYTPVETRRFNDLDVILYADPAESALSVGCES